MMKSDPTDRGNRDRDGVSIPVDGGGSRPIPPQPKPQPSPPRPAPPPIVPPSFKEALFVAPTNDVEIINSIANSLQKQPPALGNWFIDEVLWVAWYLNISNARVRPPQPSVQPVITTAPQLSSLKVMIGRLLNPVTPRSNPVDAIRNVQCMMSLANIKLFAERVTDFTAKAKNSGFSPPDNPFVAIAQLNAGRGTTFTPINVSATYASDLVFNIKVYVDLLEAENQGGINFESEDPINKAQLGHVVLSFDGLGGSGNVAADIMSFLPSSDQVKQNIAEQEFAVLDFTRRIPYLLFTLDYNVNGKSGVIIGWKKIADASGYVVQRHSSFAQSDTYVNIDNDRIKADTAKYLDYAKLHALTYLEDFDDAVVQLYFDDALLPDEYYIYTLQAFQYRSQMNGKLFSGASKAVAYTPFTFMQINDVIQKMDPMTRQITGWIPAATWDEQPTPIYKTYPSTISPWPAYAQYLITDPMHDWILAAVNIRASINRGDNRSATRKFSYLNAQHDFLTAMAQAGNLVIPDNISEIAKGVENSISQFGVSQTILEILQDTGITYYFDGRDPRDNGVFDRAGTEYITTSLFHVIASAIDPDTATIDLKAVAYNMSQLASSPGTDLKVGTDIGGKNINVNAKPSELAIPDPDKQTDTTAEDPFQFIAKLGKMDDSVVDLTTFDGISKLIRVIRIYSDFGPDKVKAVTVTTPPTPPPPNRPPPPQPPRQDPPVESPPDEGPSYDPSNQNPDGSPLYIGSA
jgi:hypothetical protein